MSGEKTAMKSDAASTMSTSTTFTLSSLKLLLHKRADKPPKPKSKRVYSPEELAKEKQLRAEASAHYFAMR